MSTTNDHLDLLVAQTISAHTAMDMLPSYRGTIDPTGPADVVWRCGRCEDEEVPVPWLVTEAQEALGYHLAVKMRAAGLLFPVEQIEDLCTAHDDDGDAPRYHWRLRANLRQEWPRFAAAVDALRGMRWA